jgi:Icc-related predicted phosphoesterase
MKLLFTADLHGLEAAYISFAETLRRERFDAGVLGGDLMTHFSPQEVDKLLDEAGLGQDDLLDELPAARPEPALDSTPTSTPSQSTADAVFARALERRAGELQSILERARVPIFFIMGNDDGIVGGGIEWRSGDLLCSVNQRRVELGEFNIVGYQYTPPFIGGMFEKPEPEQVEDLRALEPLIDEKTVLVTHGPPLGVLDGEQYGSRALLSAIVRRPPWLHLFGHIHQSAGRIGNSINGAFPQARQFVGIELESRASWAVDSGVG